ncbi:response regulator [Streptomyces sp. NPDC008150]|uniref:response regulator transcription factor n=1 Tax=Streptomyces sp. NPDC008150 TaxID=3364816 RepID=UPI0036F0307E
MQQPNEPMAAVLAGPRASDSTRVLVVDDDSTVAEVVVGYLVRAGYEVDRAGDGPTALDLAEAHRPGLVVLDLMLPGMDGLEVCRRLRERGPVPVVMLTARGDEDDRILGLEVGADDYVTKPFSPRELVLRVDAVLRRSRTVTAAPPLRAAGLAVDPVARRVTRDGVELALTLREFDLLTFFLRHPGQACSREDLMREVWGWDFGDLSTVTVHIRRLRGKVEADPARPRLIRTVWGVGYRFDPATADGPTAVPSAADDSAPGDQAPGDQAPRDQAPEDLAAVCPAVTGDAVHRASADSRAADVSAGAED